MKTAFRDTALLATTLTALTCCALPALFVMLGLGSVLASLFSVAPWLTALSPHKDWVFLSSAVLLSLAAYSWWTGRNAPCPLDPKLAAACTRTRRRSAWMLSVSAALLGVAALVAYVFPLFV